ncbi:MAG: hypothetical protein AAGC66_00225 [Leifsonia sp.]
MLAALLEGEDHVERTDSAFWLPDIARSALSDWVRAAFEHWRTGDPEAFPENAAWKHAANWSSPRELESKQRITEFDAEEEVRREQIERERQLLVTAVQSAERSGELWRSILSETGDDLVRAVHGAFEALGFSVLDADALPQHKGKKREDLRVSDKDWVSLVEVKGYSGGCQIK